MMIRFCALAILFATFQVSSGQLAVNANVVEVANTNSNSQDFAIKLSGGTGICSGSTWIVFPESKKQSEDSYKQAFAIALTALTAGSKVRIHNFEDDSCSGANFISITK